jgi:hypothetical protein
MSLKAETIKFGELLVKLRLVTEPDLQLALQVAPQFGLPVGRTLVLSGRLTEQELQLAVELQSLINREGYAIEAAKQAARLVRDKGLSPQEALKQIGVPDLPDRTTLGSILIESGAITPQNLEEARRGSYESGMRLGRLLVLKGYITHTLLTRALNFQSMVRDKRISVDQAIQMLKAQVPKEASRSVALEAHGLKPGPGPKHVRFGEFLVLCGLATESEILNAMETSMAQQCSLSEALIKLGLVSQNIFDKATELHQKVCSGETTVEHATSEIHILVFGPSPKKVEKLPVLGELLKMTGLVDDGDITEAIELSHKYPSLIGKMLVISGAIDEAMLIASLRCQYLIKHGYLGLDDAVAALQFTKKHRVSFDDALDELGIRRATHT